MVDGIEGAPSVSELLEVWLEPNYLAAEFIRERFITISRKPICDDVVLEIALKTARTELPIPPRGIEEILVRDSPPTGSRLREAILSED